MDEQLLTLGRPGRREAWENPLNWYSDSSREGFDRAIGWEPGFGRDKVYGRSAMRIRWLLRGPGGAVHFVMSTGWVPEPTTILGLLGPYTDWLHFAPTTRELGYHSRTQHYVDQTPDEYCPYIGGPCYSDGSGLRAEPVMLALFDRGEAGVWDALHAEYVLQFETEEANA